MAKVLTPEGFNKKASLVYGTYEGNGFWQEQIPLFEAEDEDSFGNPLPENEKKSAYQVAVAVLSAQAKKRRVIIAETEAEVLELMRANVVMN